MDRAIVVVSRVFGVYMWRHKHAADPDWFERRMHLLQRITLPALSRVQTPLVWVWRAHRTKMDLVAAHLEKLDLHGIDVRLVNQNAVTRRDIWPGVDKFLTFRIDTDDAWLPSAIDDIVAKAYADRTLVDFPWGMTIDWYSGEMRHRKFSSHQGPFLAVTQDRDLMLDTGGHHRKAREGRSVKHVHAISWIQVVHGGNAENRLPPPPSKDVYEHEGPYANGAPVDSEMRQRIIEASGIQLDSQPTGEMS